MRIMVEYNPVQFHYPENMETATSHEQFTFGRVHRAWGKGDSSALFGVADDTPTPWPSVSRTKKGLPYDKDVVRRVLSGPPQLHDFDPRNLHATQPTILRSHVDYYLQPEYGNTGRTSADQENVGNQHPFVYQTPDGRNLLLAGHHRAAAAVLRGEPLRARTNRLPD